MQNKITKSEFSRHAGVNPSTTTRLCKTILAAAWDGKRIDAAHPDAVSYMQKRESAPTPVTEDPPATGIDPAYQEAVDYCQKSGKYSISNLQRKLRIGYNRASRIIGVMKTSGLIPQASDPIPTFTEEKLEKTTPKLRGKAAASQTKKSIALAEANARQQSDINVKLTHEVPEDIQSFAHMTLTELIEIHGTDTAFVDWLKAAKLIEDIHEKRLKNAEKSGELVSRELVKVGIIDTIDGAFNRMLTDGAKTIALRTKAIMDSGGKLQEIEDLAAKQLGTFIRPTKSKIVRILKNA